MPRIRFRLSTLLSVLIFVNLVIGSYYTFTGYLYITPTRVFNIHSGEVSPIVFSPDGNLILSGDDSGAIIWNIRTGQQIQKWNMLGGYFCAGAWSPDGKLVLGGSTDGQIILWDVEKGTQLQEFLGHSGPIISLQLLPKTNKIVTGGILDGAMRLWDVQSGKELMQITDYRLLYGMKCSSDEARIYSVGLSPSNTPPDTISVFDAKSGVMINHQTIGPFDTQGNPVALSANSELIILGIVGSGDILLWHFTAKKGPCVVGNQSGIVSVAMSSDGTHAISSHRDGMVCLWNLKQKALSKRLYCDFDNISAIDISWNGRWVAAAGDNSGKIVLWDTFNDPSPWPCIASIAATIGFAIFIIAMKIRSRRKGKTEETPVA